MAKHNDIHAELLSRITSGAWAPGGLIPHEAELAREFDCTRPTVARALGDLVKAGLIERRRRAGSRVVERSGREAVLSIPLVRAEIEASGRRYGYRRVLRAEAPVPADLRAGFGEGPALHVICLHSADDRPYQLEDRWINLRSVPRAAQEPFTEIGPNEWLVREVPFSRAEHGLSAAAATQAEAKLLGITAGEPVFVIERQTWLGAAPVTSARLIHPGAGFRLTTRDPGVARPAQ